MRTWKETGRADPEVEAAEGVVAVPKAAPREFAAIRCAPVSVSVAPGPREPASATPDTATVPVVITAAVARLEVRASSVPERARAR
ncbi:hypothetical protein [Pseudofrankia sp. BMG5.36]|uniref:hypothetical protein n=1 Tax=Pseudofrankia sp. BMG5.36 TaxID=1834512 RepID=UPI001F523FA9|nr:hypothetical protein [Pseudofrankia sp. BMG5.36]